MTEEHNTTDFDLFWAGQEETVLPITFNAFGRIARLNIDLPLADIQAFSSVKTDNTSAMAEMAVKLFGRETYTHWLDSGIKLPQFTLLIMWAIMRVQGMNVSFDDVYTSMRSEEMGKVLTSFVSTGGLSNPPSNNSTKLTIDDSGRLVPVDSTSS